MRFLIAAIAFSWTSLLKNVSFINSSTFASVSHAVIYKHWATHPVVPQQVSWEQMSWILTSNTATQSERRKRSWLWGLRNSFVLISHFIFFLGLFLTHYWEKIFREAAGEEKSFPACMFTPGVDLGTAIPSLPHSWVVTLAIFNRKV